MDYSTLSNKTNCTEVEEVPDGELSERYYSLKKQFDTLSTSYESTKQELHAVKRNYQTALDVQRHLTVELEASQADEARKRSELNNRITSLQEELSSLREERTETIEKHSVEINRLQIEIKQLKEDLTEKATLPTIENDSSELDEARSKAVAAINDVNQAKVALEEAKAELVQWQMKCEALKVDLDEAREAAEVRREELRSANEREEAAIADLAEVKAMLHQCTEPQDSQHAAKGNSLFAEVEDKRQEMAKTLIQMKQTNTKLKRELANKQVELETLLHEKHTIWEQQLGAAAHYDRELIESYEERISQLEALTERQRRELSRWFSKLNEPTANGWLSGVLDHLKTECERLRAEVLSRGAAQLASAAHVRELRRKLAAASAGKVTEKSPMHRNSDVKENSIIAPLKTEPAKLGPVKKVDDVRKKVSFN